MALMLLRRCRSLAKVFKLIQSLGYHSSLLSTFLRRDGKTTVNAVLFKTRLAEN